MWLHFYFGLLLIVPQFTGHTTLLSLVVKTASQQNKNKIIIMFKYSVESIEKWGECKLHNTKYNFKQNPTLYTEE